MKKTLTLMKKHREKLKITVAIVGTATAGLILNAKALKQHDDFLKEKELYNEFYHIEE